MSYKKKPRELHRRRRVGGYRRKKISDTNLYRITADRYTMPTYIDLKLYRRVVEKKRELDSHRPLPPRILKKIASSMQVEYVYNTNAIEGNTLTHRETELVIKEGMTIRGKPVRDVLEAKNHPDAIKYMEQLAKSGHKIREDDILELHRLAMKGVLSDAGRYRREDVKIAGGKFTPPPLYLISEEIRKLINHIEFNPWDLRPIELAAQVHHTLTWIHPFTDGNGRVARLLMNLILVKYGYPITVIMNVDRKRYYKALSEADEGNFEPFATFIARAVEQTLDLYLSSIEGKRRRLISLAQAAKGTPYSQEYLSLLARRGKLDAVKRHGVWMTTKEVVQRYIRDHKRS